MGSGRCGGGSVGADISVPPGEPDRYRAAHGRARTGWTPPPRESDGSVARALAHREDDAALHGIPALGARYAASSMTPPPEATPEAPTGKAATQARILAAATQLFIERGYENTTVQDVADQAGVSRATVFWHFSEKAALFRESFTRLCEPFRASLDRDASDVEPGKRLLEQIEMSAQFARDHSNEIRAFVRWAVESPEFRESVITTLLDLNQRFAGAITQTVAEIAPPGHDPKLLANSLMLAFDANLLLSVFDEDVRAQEERTAAVASLAAFIADAGRRR